MATQPKVDIESLRVSIEEWRRDYPQTCIEIENALAELAQLRHEQKLVSDFLNAFKFTTKSQEETR